MNNLKKLRKDRNIKVKDIIESLDISQPYYYDLENSTKRLNDELINKFADFYKVTTDYILGRVDVENHVVLEGNSLPERLRGIIDKIAIAKDVGLSEADILEIAIIQKRYIFCCNLDIGVI